MMTKKDYLTYIEQLKLVEDVEDSITNFIRIKYYENPFDKLIEIRNNLNKIVQTYKNFESYIPFIENLILTAALKKEKPKYIVDLSYIENKDEYEIFTVELMLKNLGIELQNEKNLIELKSKIPSQENQNGGSNEYHKIIENIRNFI